MHYLVILQLRRNAADQVVLSTTQVHSARQQTVLMLFVFQLAQRNVLYHAAQVKLIFFFYFAQNYY